MSTSNKPVVLGMFPLAPAARKAFDERYTLYLTNPSEVEGMASDSPMAEAEMVITNGVVGLSRASMGKLPRLRLAASYGVGYEGIDTAAARERGVVVANGPGGNSETVADHAVGLMLALARGYLQSDGAIRSGKWEQHARPTLWAARLGIVGMGNVGRGIARRAEGFQMKISYHTPSPKNDLPYRHCGSIEQLAAESDFLVLACSGGAATRKLVDAAVLRALGQAGFGFLVNVSRGSVVDTDALVRALADGLIGGAGLDVFDHEPDVPPALLAQPNVIVTPHMAGRSPAATKLMVDMMMANVDAVRDGKPVPYAVA